MLISQALTSAVKRRAQGHVAPKAAKIAILAIRLNVASIEVISEGHEAVESLVSYLLLLCDLQQTE